MTMPNLFLNPRRRKSKNNLMKPISSSSFFLFVIFCLLNPAEAQTIVKEPQRSLDNLLKISSVVGGGNPPQWSPDGRQILFQSGLNDGNLISLNPNGGFPVRLPIDIGEGGQHRWSPDGKWVSYISSKSGFPEIWIWSVADGQDRCLTNLGGRIMSLNWSNDGKWIVFSDDHYGNFDIWKVSVPGAKLIRLTEDRCFEVFPMWTPDSKRIVYVRLDESWLNHDVLEMNEEGGKPRLIISDTDFFDYREGRTFGFPLVSPDGKMVLFRSHRSDWINYWVVSLSGGEPRQMAAEKADQSEARWSPDSTSIAYVSNQNGTHVLRVVPSEGGESRILVAPKMGVCANIEWSPDGSQISYTLTTPTSPEDLYVVSAKDGKSKQLTFSMMAGNLEKTLVTPEKISYSSTDGFAISAYLYKPQKTNPGEKHPCILWIHGGPTGQFNDNFQQHVQFFVQNGYVLLLPNIRGSSGYGKAFEKANNKCWGECDLKDVLAGVDYLKTLPFVDPDNMGITGTSYGGDFTMAAVGRAPGVFQAAISGSGEADWTRAYHENVFANVKLWDYELGPLKGNEELYKRLSPVTRVADVTTPTFVLHGEGIFPETQLTKLFATELQRHYKVFEYKVYQGETMYVRGLENRRQMLLDMLDFFDRFLKKT